MTLGLRGRILLAFGFVLAVLGAVGAGFWRETGDAPASIDATAESNRRIELVDDLLRAVGGLDQATRGFVSTGQTDMLANYETARNQIAGLLDVLAGAKPAEPDRMRELEQLRAAVAAKIESTDAAVAARREPGWRAASPLITHDHERQLSRRIRRVLFALRTRERFQLRERHNALARSVRVTRAGLGLALAMGLLMTVFASYQIVREVAERDRAKRALAASEAQLREAHEARGKLIAELKEALANVRTLSGLLPVCANCRKVRDDTGYWSSVEHYISEHTDARFSHGVCPDCFPKLFPGIPLPEPEKNTSS